MDFMFDDTYSPNQINVYNILEVIRDKFYKNFKNLIELVKEYI